MNSSGQESWVTLVARVKDLTVDYVIGTFKLPVFSQSRAREEQINNQCKRLYLSFHAMSVCPGIVCHGECDSLDPLVGLNSTQLLSDTSISFSLIQPPLHLLWTKQLLISLRKNGGSALWAAPFPSLLAHSCRFVLLFSSPRGIFLGQDLPSSLQDFPPSVIPPLSHNHSLAAQG